MAMSKKEAQALADALHDAELARALAWPQGTRPVPLTEDDVRKMVKDAGLSVTSGARDVTVWFANSYCHEVTKGLTNGSSHARDQRWPESRSRDIGQCFASAADAWGFILHVKAVEYAASMLLIRRQLAAAMQ